MKNIWIAETSWLNLPFLKGAAPRAVVVSFHGLGGGWRNENADELEIELADHGVLVVYPYCGPWSWMNRECRSFVDQLLDAIYAEFDLGNAPLAASGGSMGGCASLLYARYGARRPVCCEALFPVCDTASHFRERPDLPSTFHSAFRGYPEPLEAVLREHSPLAQVADMPDIPYLVTHGDRDEAVGKAFHSDPFVAAMRREGRRVEYVEVPGMGHGANIPFRVNRRRADFLLDHLRAR